MTLTLECASGRLLLHHVAVNESISRLLALRWLNEQAATWLVKWLMKSGQTFKKRRHMATSKEVRAAQRLVGSSGKVMRKFLEAATYVNR